MFKPFIAVLFMTIYCYCTTYYPLALGNEWVYDILDTNENYIALDTIGINEDSLIDDMHLFHMRGTYMPPLGSVDDWIYEKNGIIYHYHMNTKESYVFAKSNYVDDEIWAIAGGIDTLRVNYIGEVTVPAGTFDSCYFVPWSTLSGIIYAPNVGKIKTIFNGKTSTILTSLNVDINNFEINKGYLENKNSLKIYPNPINRTDNIFFHSPNLKINEIIIYSISGKIIQKHSNINGRIIDMKKIDRSNSVFLFEFRSKNDRYVKKVIVNN